MLSSDWYWVATWHVGSMAADHVVIHVDDDDINKWELSLDACPCQIKCVLTCGTRWINPWCWVLIFGPYIDGTSCFLLIPFILIFLR
ncbi:hypothetical protein RchiOBHm_Chr7g0181781 [Rosa chinensis]|uniref:Uncharacterized protein n=1 Tax=Rosa chinensis TaxID=74649 RepID=A0A2P6P2Q3_ROSCH|nr:hypothetical protein RchiOBHm_Chr7g0181781 [Rosa chinensis]